jgi:hypothetical protein
VECGLLGRDACDRVDFNQIHRTEVEEICCNEMCQF